MSVTVQRPVQGNERRQAQTVGLCVVTWLTGNVGFFQEPVWVPRIVQVQRKVLRAAKVPVLKKGAGLRQGRHRLSAIHPFPQRTPFSEKEPEYTREEKT